ncbi:unnamed protein product, partial [Chrysoparadoxa australica]
MIRSLAPLESIGEACTLHVVVAAGAWVMLGLGLNPWLCLLLWGESAVACIFDTMANPVPYAMGGRKEQHIVSEASDREGHAEKASGSIKQYADSGTTRRTKRLLISAGSPGDGASDGTTTRQSSVPEKVPKGPTSNSGTQSAPSLCIEVSLVPLVIGSMWVMLTREGASRTPHIAYIAKLLECALLCSLEALLRVLTKKALVSPCLLVSVMVLLCDNWLLNALCLCLYKWLRRMLEGPRAFAQAAQRPVGLQIEEESQSQLAMLSLQRCEASLLCQGAALWLLDGILFAAPSLLAQAQSCLQLLQPSSALRAAAASEVVATPSGSGSAASWSSPLLQAAGQVLGLMTALPQAPMRSDEIVVVQTGVLGMVFSAGVLSLCLKRLGPRTNWLFGDATRELVVYSVLSVTILIWVAAWMAPALGQNPLWWIAGMLFTSTPCLCLTLYWLLLLAAAVALIPQCAKRHAMRVTVTRKLYHVLTVVMFAPPLMDEGELRHYLALAYGVALGLLLLLECLRCTGTRPLGPLLHEYYSNVAGSRDDGLVFTTHLQLLLGAALPLWLTMERTVSSGAAHTSRAMLGWSGVVVLGVGDALGAVVGSVHGRRRWPGSQRTIEGSAACFLGTLLTFSLILMWYQGGGGSLCSYLWLVLPSMQISLMEAFTRQSDNLILPCFAYA